jgi:uncharacterized membrane protein
MLLPFALIPALKSLNEVDQAKFLETFTKHFNHWFVIAVIVVTATGVLQLVHPDLVEEMTNNGMLILKHTVMLPLIISSIYVWFILARKLGKANKDRSRLMKQFVIFGWVQAILSIAVLIITGILTG